VAAPKRSGGKKKPVAKPFSEKKRPITMEKIKRPIVNPIEGKCKGFERCPWAERRLCQKIMLPTPRVSIIRVKLTKPILKASGSPLIVKITVMHR
jgi:hypothetical protein